MSAISPLTYTSTDNYARINTFSGLMQQGDGENLNLSYAVEGKNFDTTDGALRPFTAGTALTGDLPAPIGTLAALYRRYGEYTDPTLLVAAAGGKLYARTLTATTWTQIYSGLQSDSFDFVTYEINMEGGQQLPDPVDVLLMTNAKDGMLCVRGDNLTVSTVTTPKKFGILARHAERIWGSGIEDNPDQLVYSAPFDPFDWEANVEIPEDGAGDILQPSWDGDSFVALRPFGSQLIALKKHRVWRILGTDPGNYIMKEQYGGGTIVENTVVVNGSYMLMLGDHGLMLYDGTDVSAFQHEAVQGVMRRLNSAAVARATAIVHDNKYYLALPLDSSMINNSVLIYNLTERTFNLIEGVYVRTFLEVETELYYTSDATPSRIWSMSGGSTLPVTWVSAWQDMGIKNVTKSAFEILMASDVATEITIGIRTEKKLKQKILYLPAGRIRRVRVANHGRRWRLELSTAAGVDPYTLIGGVQIMMELDYD